MSEIHIVTRARDFCIEAHCFQVRKYTGEPYWYHCAGVVHILKQHGFSAPVVLAAAYLHDTVEDTKITFKEIYAEFGEQVGDLVFWLTDVSKPSMGNRALRKHLDKIHMWGAPYRAQIIKCADCIDNGIDIRQNDPDFAVVYFKEKDLLLDGMQSIVKPEPIWQAAKALVR